MEQEAIKPSNTEILIDGEMIGGYLVKPWTIRKGAALTPVIEKIGIEFKKRKIAFKDFFAISEDGKKVEAINVDQMLYVIMPFVPEVIEKTLSISPEESDKISQENALIIFMTIVKQNLDYLKNLFALMAGLTKSMKATV